MSRPFFKPEDFKPANRALKHGEVTEQANRLLKERGKVFYGTPDSVWGEGKSFDDTHRALLVCMEEIKKELCKHETEETTFPLTLKKGWIYKHCDVELELVWKVKE